VAEGPNGNGRGAGQMVARRQLGRQLKGLRLGTGMTQQSAATQMEWRSQARLQRLETASPKVEVTSRDIRALCELYGATPEVTAKVLATFEQTRVNGAWASHYGREIPEWFALYTELEPAASAIREYHALLVTGVFQTREYATAVMRAHTEDNQSVTEQMITERVEIRMHRADLLHRESPPPPTMDLVLDEAVIRRPIGGPAVMAAQLRHLVEVSELSRVTVRILPFGAGMHRGMLADGSFVIMDFPADGEPTTVYLEGLTGAAYLDDEAEVARHVWAFEGLLHASLSAAKSRDLLISASKEYEQ
jgi:transcriptional regulator with XRE-family HTH domain